MGQYVGHTKGKVVTDGLTFEVDAGNNLTQYSQTRTQDVADFDGTTNWFTVATTDLNFGTDGFTVSWTDEGDIVSRDILNTGPIRILTWSNGNMVIEIFTSGGNYVTYRFVHSNNRLKNYTITYNGGTTFASTVVELHTNGVKSEPTSPTETGTFTGIGTFSTSLSIGNVASSRPFLGLMKNVTFWNTALSDFRIKAFQQQSHGIKYVDVSDNHKQNMVVWYDLEGVDLLKDSHGVNNLTAVGTFSTINDTYTFINQKDIVNKKDFIYMSGANNNNGVYEFDGTDDYILVDDFIDPTRPEGYTYNVWVKLNDIDAFGMFIWKGRDANANDLFSVGYHGNTKKFTTVASSSGVQHRANSVIEPLPNIWYNVTATVKTNDEIILYINGQQEGSLSLGTLINSTTRPLYIGMGNLSSTDSPPTIYWPLNGELSQVKIYDRVLTPTEVKQNYEALKYRYL